jgi:hypothetical protein
MPASNSRSGNPAKKASARKAAPKQQPTEVTPASEWKVNREGELLQLPSGKTARIVRIQLPALIAENLLGDSISVLAQQAVDRGQGMNQDEIRKMSDDPKKIQEALDAFDKIAARCFAEPKVTYYKDAAGKLIADDDRDPDALYSDEIDIQDKIYLFQVVAGGTTDLQSFRKQFSESLAGISAS